MFLGDLWEIGKERFLQKWENRDSRHRMILVFLVFILIVVVVVQIPGPQTVPHLRVLICHSCGQAEIRLFVDINDVRCTKCPGKMGYGFKCLECDYEFPFSPREILNPDQYSKKELREMKISEKVCPNCGSYETFAIPGPLFKYWQKHGRGDKSVLEKGEKAETE